MLDLFRVTVSRKKSGSRSRIRPTRKLGVEALERREVPAALVLPETIPPSFQATTPNGDIPISAGNYLGSLNGNTPLTASYSVDVTTNIQLAAGTATYPNAAVTADGTTYRSPVPNAGAIAWLVENLGPTATTPLQQDALQAAIWRTEYGNNFQLDGVDNGNTVQTDSPNPQIAPFYQAYLQQLGTNTAPVSAVSWVSPGTTGFSTLNGPGLVALQGQPVAQTPATLALPQSSLPNFSADFPINEGGQIFQSGGDVSAGNFGGLLNGNTPLTVSYCVNLYTNLFPGTTYANATLTGDGTTYANPVPNAGAIAWLVTNLGPSATAPEQQDALQAAIWRTEYGSNFQLNGIDNNNTATAFNQTIAPLYQQDLAALGNNTAPVDSVVWISPGANPDGTQGQALVALAPVTAPPLGATSITWHTNADDGGGVDLKYHVNGGPLAADHTLTVYWSNEATFDPNNPNQKAADSVTVPAGTAAGTHTVQVTAAELGQPLPGTTDLLLVVDPPGATPAVAAAGATGGPQALDLPCGPKDILSPVPSSSGTGMVPPITLQLGSAGGSAPVPGNLPVGEIDALFQPAGGALEIEQAAVICGVDHFNWTQQIKQVPAQWTYFSYQTGQQQQEEPPLPANFPDKVTYLRKITSSTFPPLASTPYANPLRRPQAISSRSEPQGDAYGFYWNEILTAFNYYDPDINNFQGGTNEYTTRSAYTDLELNPNLNTFKFEDRPELPRFTINGTNYSYFTAGAANQFIGFQTTLVGVDANHQLVNLPNLADLTFSWKDNATFTGTPYTNILGGAYFGDALDPNEPPTTAGGVFGVQLNLGQAVNHAPTWTGGGATLTAVPAGATDPGSDSVVSVFGSSFNDSDGDPAGVAVTGLTGTAGGTWQYSLDAGLDWTDFGAVSAGSARLLSATDLVRFVPDAGFTGTATLQAAAWDQTTGTDGGTADLSGAGSTGGSTAFSTATLTATVQVTAAAPPTSSVAALPAATDSASFTVSWSGSPSAPGLSIAGYTVYVSDNGGPYTAWQRNTTATSATYTGQDGHSYSFYSVGTDSAGDVQPTPAAAQATTRVDLDPPTSSVNPLPAVINSPSFTVSWSGADNTGGSGIRSFDVFVSVDGGAFQPWLAGTAQTSATYTGALGHSYGFYSVATDNAGNRQPTPTAAQAEATLVQPPTPIGARLVNVKVGRRRRLMVEVFDADTGALREEFLSPFQSPAYRAIHVTTIDSNGDGVPDEVVLTARRGRHTVTRDFAG